MVRFLGSQCADTHQLSTYLDGYHERLDGGTTGSEIITELYVPRSQLVSFMSSAASILRKRKAEVIYGTVRLIEKDRESFLAWAKDDFACIIFNLHTAHQKDSIARVAETFRALIDLAIEHQGSFYLTYHRFASKDQIASCYPQFERFMRKKKDFDPMEVFQSSWYLHYR